MKWRKDVGVVVMMLFVAGLGASCAKHADGVRLRLRLERGRTYRVLVTTDREIDQTIRGKQYRMKQTIGMGYSFTVDDVDKNGAMTGKVTYESALLKQYGPSGAVEYDSAKPPKVVPPAAMGLAGLVGRSFSMTITSMGKVKALKGLSAMLTKLADKLPLPKGPRKTALSRSMGEQFGYGAFKETMENMMAYLPDQAVRVGDTWQRQVSFSRRVQMKMANVYRLKARKGGVATLGVLSKVEPNPEAAPLRMGAIKLTYSVSGTQQGTLEIDERTGWLVGGSLTQDVSGTVRKEPVSGAPEPVNVPIVLKISIRFSRAEY